MVISEERFQKVGDRLQKVGRLLLAEDVEQFLLSDEESTGASGEGVKTRMVHWPHQHDTDSLHPAMSQNRLHNVAGT